MIKIKAEFKLLGLKISKKAICYLFHFAQFIILYYFHFMLFSDISVIMVRLCSLEEVSCTGKL